MAETGIKSVAADFAGSSVGKHLANPLGIGGNRVTRTLADPLGLFNRGKRKISPTKRARLDEQARQDRMKEASDRVNAVYDDPSRALQRDDFVQALRDQYSDQLSRQKAVADRRLKFSLARSGLTGGSAAVDANRTLGEDFTMGLVDAENRAQGGGADLLSQDEESRLALLQLVRAGMDTATAGSRAQAALLTNLERTRTGALTDSLGDVFGNTATIYKRQEEGAERRRGEQAAFDSIYGRRSAWG